MSDQPVSAASPQRTITLGFLFGWAFTILFGLAALGLFVESQPVPAILTLVAAAISCPSLMSAIGRFGGVALSGGVRFVLALGLIIAAGALMPKSRIGENSSTNGTESGSSGPAQPAKTITPQTLLDIDGSGTKTTEKFTTQGDDWELSYSYDCSEFGYSGNFIVDVKGGDGSSAGMMVNVMGRSGSDLDHYHTGGTFYLEVNSECRWHITVTG